MMQGGSQLERFVEEAVRRTGYDVFDLETPGSGGVLRIFLCKPDGGTSGIGLEDCARVSRALSESSELDDLIPGHYVLEVSSAGVNRRLRSARHFAGAVGEHVRLVVDSSAYAKAGGKASGKRTVVKGVIESFGGDSFELADDALKHRISLAVGDVGEARVDFVFT
jgi:ribosome maturation factor RimP